MSAAKTERVKIDLCNGEDLFLKIDQTPGKKDPLDSENFFLDMLGIAAAMEL